MNDENFIKGIAVISIETVFFIMNVSHITFEKLL